MQCRFPLSCWAYRTRTHKPSIAKRQSSNDGSIAPDHVNRQASFVNRKLQKPKFCS